jgi:hypothetical protein
MSTKFEGRLSRHDFIDDIVEPSSSSYQIKTIQNRNYSTFSSLPSLLHKTDNSPIIITNELRDRLPLTLPRSNSSLIMMSNDDRRKEIDLIIKHLYDGKLITTLNDDHQPLDDSEPSIHMLSKELLTTTTDKENKNNVGTIDVSILIKFKKNVLIRSCRAEPRLDRVQVSKFWSRCALVTRLQIIEKSYFVSSK